MESAIKHDIALLDFVRGYSAILVFLHHAAILGGGPYLLIGGVGKEAVNAFMLASGFLIYFQCSIGKSYYQLSNYKGIRNFYIRRVFRIAPVYYLCLIIALLMSDYLGASREAIAEVLPGTITDMSRYYITDPVTNFFLHISFIFGAIPSYSFSTPLPDWSLGLEMQFYVIFPLLYAFYKRNFVVFFIVSVVGMFLVWELLNSLNIAFPMPSFIALKFHNFAAGIALAYLLLEKERRSKSYYIIILLTILVLFFGNRTPFMPALFIFSWWWICIVNTASNPIFSAINFLFSHKTSKFFSEMSYSVYIFHLVLMLPFFAVILSNGTMSRIEWVFFSSVLLICCIAIGYLFYRYIELPGIKIGKSLIK